MNAHAFDNAYRNKSKKKLLNKALLQIGCFAAHRLCNFIACISVADCLPCSTYSSAPAF